MFAYLIQINSLQSILGVTIAKLFIEVVILFCALLLRQVHLPALVRYQHTYGHLSDSMLAHSNGLIMTCITSVSAWVFIVFITSSELKPEFMDFGFSTTIGIFIAVTIFIILKSAPYLSKLLGASGIVAISRIVGFIVIAIGIQYIVSALINIIKSNLI